MQQQDSKLILVVARGAEAQGTLERINAARDTWQRDRDEEQRRHEDHVTVINGRLASAVNAMLTEYQRRLDVLDASDDDDEKRLDPF